MSQTYTLDEAADKLNLSVEEFKRRLRGEWSQKVHVFRDGSTLRFRANEIEELARTLGLGSSDELPLAESSPLDLPADIGLAPEPGQAKKPDSGAPLKLDDSDEVFLLAPDASGKPPSSKKLKGRQDSDVRLEKSTKVAAGEDAESILTEEIQKPGEGGSGKLSGKSGKLSAAKLKAGDSGTHKPVEARTSDSGKAKAAAAGKPAEDDSSEFELTLDADSDEFELSLAPDSSEEVALGEMPPETAKGKSGNSGINLNRPADSGVSLEKRKPKGDEEEVDFELSLEAPGSGSSRKKLGSGSKLKPDSDSEFELTLEEPSDLGADVTEAAPEKKGDIFEATDFEIPALEDDSASEAVSLEEADTDLESSDFDLALDEADVSAEDESASEVVALDERGPRSKRRKKALDDDDGAVDLGDDLEEGPSASKALRGVRRDEDDEDYEVSEAAEDQEVAVAAPAKWGGLTVLGMFVTVIVMFLAGLMAFELLHSAWGYQQSAKPTTPLVTWLAETTGMKTSQ
jgi:hypothetical protein